MFEELKNGNVLVTCRLYGFKRSGSRKRGIHVHETGDLRYADAEGCCKHFNPSGASHGPRVGVRSGYEFINKNRHVGDLGNIDVDSQGNVECQFVDSFIALRGKRNIIGRSIVIHANEDDLGKTDHPLSSTTGNSGSRVAAGVIGYAAQCLGDYQ